MMSPASPSTPSWLPAFAARLEDAVQQPIAGLQAAPLAGGACQENFKIDATIGGASARFALRSDAALSLPGSLDRATEADVIHLAATHGVPTPDVVHRFPDLLRDGATAVLLEWCDGQAIGARVLRSPDLADARQVLPDQLAAALAAIHRITPADAPGLELPVPQSARPGEGGPEAALRFNREMIDRLPGAHPELELAHRWLRDHAPAPAPLTLVHGDFRMGNFLVAPTGLAGVLDWEFAHWGSPAADLGWLCVRDWRFGHLDRPVAGLTDRRRFLSAYAEAGGQVPQPAELHWWEVCGNLRWAAGACYQAERVLDGHESDLELLAIGRRACEMAYEALRLIDCGPE